MRFISISEYFYKFYSMVLLIILFPIIAFIALYLQPVELQTDFQTAPDSFIFFTGCILILWLVVFIFFNKKIKSLRNRQGLRQKLDKYFQLTIVRYSTLSLTGLILAIAFYILRHDFFTLVFVIHLCLTVLLWPTSGKVCRDLKLKGDEHQMVFYRKDVL
jgi:hypothetical protein